MLPLTSALLSCLLASLTFIKVCSDDISLCPIRELSAAPGSITHGADRQRRKTGMNIRVTGGAGFIDSHLVEALVESGHGVRVLDDFTTGHRENLRRVMEKIERDIVAPQHRCRWRAHPVTGTK